MAIKKRNMKTILTILFLLLSLPLTSQNNNDETFEKALTLLTQNIKKDSMGLSKQIDVLKEQIAEIEKEHNFNYQDIQEWLSLNFYGRVQGVQEEFLYTYFKDWELDDLESTQNFIDKLNNVNKDNEPDMMFFWNG